MMTAARTGDTSIRDEAVRKRTGRSWQEWFEILDAWNAADKGHKATARYLKREHELSSWWSQMVTVQYERERGLRKVGQRADDSFVVSVQRTVEADRERAYEALTKARHLARWYAPETRVSLEPGGRFKSEEPAVGTVKAIDPPRRLAFRWKTPVLTRDTAVEFTLDPRSEDRTVLRVTHSKLTSKKEREKMKRHWGRKMDALKTYLVDA